MSCSLHTTRVHGQSTRPVNTGVENDPVNTDRDYKKLHVCATTDALVNCCSAVRTGALKMHDLKMTDKENYGSGKCKSGK